MRCFNISVCLRVMSEKKNEAYKDDAYENGVHEDEVHEDEVC